MWKSTETFFYIPEGVLENPEYISFQGLNKATSSGPFQPQPFCDLCGSIFLEFPMIGWGSVCLQEIFIWFGYKNKKTRILQVLTNATNEFIQ